MAVNHDSWPSTTRRSTQPPTPRLSPSPGCWPRRTGGHLHASTHPAALASSTSYAPPSLRTTRGPATTTIRWSNGSSHATTIPAHVTSTPAHYVKRRGVSPPQRRRRRRQRNLARIPNSRSVSGRVRTPARAPGCVQLRAGGAGCYASTPSRSSATARSPRTRPRSRGPPGATAGSGRSRGPQGRRARPRAPPGSAAARRPVRRRRGPRRSEEHTSELQSRRDLVCRLLLEKKKKKEKLLLHEKKKKKKEKVYQKRIEE